MKSIFPKIFLLFLLFTAPVFIACSNIPDTEIASSQPNKSKLYSIKKIVDGDTFWIDNGVAKGLKIRLIGVNAPESRKTNRKDVEYFGKEAKNYLIKFLSNKRVRLVYDVAPKDRYGRALAYVYLEDGTFLNAHLVKNGYASVMTIPPNVKYADYFVKLQREARLNKRGLWGR
ncbi:thermonuclease family protein [Daejeonella sp.]|uniref:thermonuclease family protein n=1 Tax=Daejeonella sp. TaxID=2805397 RepID=UPI0025C1D003|nr:thermonuclease family protein [Daejeonella sp.]